MQFNREEEITAELNMAEYVFMHVNRHIVSHSVQGGDRKIRQAQEKLRRPHVRSGFGRLPRSVEKEDHRRWQFPEVRLARLS